MDAATYDLIVTDVRLGEYNGVHLAHLALLAASGPPATRAIVYDKDGDPGAARAAHQAGAFFEVASRLLITLPAYLGNPLPPIDRRSARASDRRAAPRGGRRLWDIHLLAAGVASL